MARRKSSNTKAEISQFESQMANIERQTSAMKRQRRNIDRPTVRSTIYVYEDQWKLLDRRAAQSKTDTNSGIGRSEVVRALIDFFIELKPDLKKVASEEELVELIKASVPNES